MEIDLSKTEAELLEKIVKFKLSHEFLALLVVVVLILGLIVVINIFNIKVILPYLFPLAIVILGFALLATNRMLNAREDIVRKLYRHIERLESRKKTGL